MLKGHTWGATRQGPSYYLSATFNAQSHLSMSRFPTGTVGLLGLILRPGGLSPPFFGRCSVTANPDKTNRCWLPTWTYAVVPITTVIPMGMIMVVVMIVVMVMIVIVRVMFMIVIVIMPLIVTLLLMTLLLMTLLLTVTLLLMTLLLVVTVLVIFSEGRYRKRQSTYYRADEREFANHLVSLCY